MSDDADRLREIVSAFLACGQALEDEAVARQFRYETGRPPFPPQLERAIERGRRHASRA